MGIKVNLNREQVALKKGRDFMGSGPSVEWHLVQIPLDFILFGSICIHFQLKYDFLRILTFFLMIYLVLKVRKLIQKKFN